MTESTLGAFSEDHAVALTGVSRVQLRHWDRIGLLHPSYGAGNTGLPYGRIYSFRDLVSLRVLGQLRNEHKVSVPHLKKVFAELSKMAADPWAEIRLQVLGKRVVIAEPSTRQKREVVSGQQVLDVPLKVIINGMRDAVTKLNERRAEDVGHVVHAKFVSENQMVIAGTRIPVAVIKSFGDAGYSVSQILKEYPDITADDVRAALTYSGAIAAA